MPRLLAHHPPRERGVMSDEGFVDTCAHGEPEGDCPSCAACAACDGGCGACPYLRFPADPPTTTDQRATGREREQG